MDYESVPNETLCSDTKTKPGIEARAENAISVECEGRRSMKHISSCISQLLRFSLWFSYSSNINEPIISQDVLPLNRSMVFQSTFLLALFRALF